MTTKII